MARNGSGVYSVPKTFSPNTTMSAQDVDQNFTDAGTEITNSLARDGQSSMSGPLLADDGTVGAPGLSWGVDTNTGFRRASADEMRWVAGGADRLYVDSTGKLWALGDWDVAGTLNVQTAISGAGVADLAVIEALSSTGAARRTGSNAWSLDDGTTGLTFIKDGCGSVLATGIQGDLQVPYACTITGVILLADQSGSIVVDIWKDTYANYPPTVADTITASALPTISSATKYTDTTLTGWTVAVSAGDTIRFNINSITSITRITVVLKVKRFT